MEKYKSWEVPENNYKEAKNGQIKEFPQKEFNMVSNNPQNDNSVSGIFPTLLKTGLHKGIVNQLPPEQFSPEDIQHLQKLNRDLHTENLKKTLAYLKLEQDYHLLKDEITEIKQENEKRRQESNLLLQNALDEISAHQKCLSQNSKACERNSTDPKGRERNPNDIPERQKLLKELHDLEEMFDKLQRKESQARRQVQIYQEKYHYFEDVVHNSSIYLDESKKQLDASLKKVKILELELETWKNNCLEYEELAVVQHNRQLQSEMQAVQSAHPASQQRISKLDQTFVNNAIFKYLKPKGNPN